MNRIRKTIHVISWAVIIILGMALLVRWNDISEPVITHIGAGISYGSKSTLAVIYIIEIIVNAVFTFGYEIPFAKEMRKTGTPNLLVDVVSVVLQAAALLVVSGFILPAVVTG
ncbi:MAG TPA: hypothetical protein H9852_07050 [Candidatus Mediterraneibacter colneyensis]|nr:hypothetical protein [Candidatus Mediterraneibacter colneyensis]